MSKRVNVLVLDEIFSDPLKEVQEQFSDMEINVAAGEVDRDALAAAEVIVAQMETVTGDLLDAAANLRLLVKIGRNYSNIDVDEARKRDIPVAMAPRKGPNCVAELAITLILALSKDLIWAHRNVADGAYRRRGLRPSLTTQRSYSFHWMKMIKVHEIREKTLGIVGMGEIGTELARRANALGMKVLYYNRSRRSSELEQRYGVEYSGLNNLLEVSDHVCLAVPYTPDTDHLIGAKELGLMGSHAYLVNICRGRVVDEEALIEALQNEAIAGAGLDVFAYEPLPADSPLCTLSNVILTPHIGGGTGSNDTLELRETLVEVQSILAGNPPKHPV
jgi:phosphoglycerate dehydrogenase-like enzyme